jgi:hypothetical protein
MFSDGQTNAHDKARSGRPCIVCDDLVQSVDQKICETWHFTISELSREFPQISHTISMRLPRLGKAATNFAQA